MAEGKRVKLKINDAEYEVPADWSLIKACHENGVTVPHYCYHPDLSVAGNCRMCLVKVKGMPKPVIACGTPITEGMEVDTISADVEAARSSVMEFLLINHPLDCPECDQAGECRLQNYSYEYGRDHGRFEEAKVIRKKATLGPHVKYWGSRCIVCTRCVRFTDEISGTGELAVINRGDHSEIAVFPGQTLDNPLSMNTVDVCPVGALVSADFLYRERVWYLNSKKSICADCAVGCNTRVDSDKKGEIKRVAPRRNDAVNKEWMCDAGRLSFPYVYEYRLAHPLRRNREATWDEALEAALAALRQSQNLLLLVSAWTTNAGLRAALELSRALPGARLAAFANPRSADQVFPGFTISGDKNPNRAGVAEILGIADIEAHLASQAPADVAFTLGNIPRFQPSPELFGLLDRAQAIVALDFYRSAFVEHERTVVALPGLSHFEKAGEFTNRQGLAQTFEAAIEPVGEGRAETDVLNAMVQRLAHSGAVAG